MTRLKPDLRLLAVLAVAATVADARPHAALAVDVINDDAAAREIVVNTDNGESKTVTLAPRQKIKGVCESCVVVLGKASVEASKTDVVKIAGGKISVHGK